jgi:hypothetical protein
VLPFFNVAVLAGLLSDLPRNPPAFVRSIHGSSGPYGSQDRLHDFIVLPGQVILPFLVPTRWAIGSL